MTPVPGVTQHDLTTLAKTIYGEARGETIPGQIAVAWVVRNRLGRWRSTIAKVCLQPKQFSCWNTNDPNRSKLDTLELPNPAYLRAISVAAKVLAGDAPDLTNGATHYLAPGSLPNGLPAWVGSMTIVAKLGNHFFYREMA